jgi:hypothetical protein
MKQIIYITSKFNPVNGSRDKTFLYTWEINTVHGQDSTNSGDFAGLCGCEKGGKAGPWDMLMRQSN